MIGDKGKEARLQQYRDELLIVLADGVALLMQREIRLSNPAAVATGAGRLLGTIRTFETYREELRKL